MFDVEEGAIEQLESESERREPKTPRERTDPEFWQPVTQVNVGNMEQQQLKDLRAPAQPIHTVGLNE